MTTPARRAAHQVLRDVHTGRANLPQALTRVRQHLVDPRDRALASNIAAGTLRWQATLDHQLAQVTSKPLAQLDGEVLDLLRAGVYQLLHLERVPEYAVVNDTVALTRLTGKRRASGLVNAVLRAIATRRDKLPLPPPPCRTTPTKTEEDRRVALDYLSVTLSHPRWLVERWLDRYGFEAAERWAQFNNELAPITLRVNRLVASPSDVATRLEAHGVRTRPGSWSQDTLIVTDGNPLATPTANDGSFLVQDETSQLIGELVTATPGQLVLDACASPGGKTVTIAGAMQDRGIIVAADFRARRLTLLTETLARCRVSCVHVVRLDLRRQTPFSPVFDWVLVDAPCSGLGTIRRDPDIRWCRAPNQLSQFAAAQTAMLRNAADAVRPGGHLVYATCSSEPDENDEVIARLLASRPDFSETPITLRRLAPLLTPKGRFETRPDQHALESFFAVIMQREIP